MGTIDLRQLPGHILRMGIALQGVPKHIGDNNIVAAHLGADNAGIVLIHLQHHRIHSAAIGEGHRASHGRSNAEFGVAANAVVGHGAPGGRKQITEKVCRGGLAVGAGDADDRFGLADVPQIVRAQLHGKPTRQIRCLPAQQTHPIIDALAHRHSKQKTKIHSFPYLAYKIIRLFYSLSPFLSTCGVPTFSHPFP